MVGIVPITKMREMEISVSVLSIIRLRSAKIFKPSGRGILQTIILITIIKGGNSSLFFDFLKNFYYNVNVENRKEIEKIPGEW